MNEQDEKIIPRASASIYRNVPAVVQMEAVECGAACLGSVLGYYGKYLPLEELRKDCHVSRDGVSVGGILEAAEKQGLLAEPHSISLEQLYEMPLPLIAFWNMNHFVVIEGFSKNAVYIMDPSIGKVTISYEELNRSFSGVVVLFDTTIDFQKSGHPYSIIDALVQAYQSEKKGFHFAFLAGLALVLPQLAIPAIGQLFIDNVLSVNLFNWSRWLLYIILFIITLTFVIKYLETNILSRLYIKMTTAFSGRFLWQILRLPYKFYLSRFSGEIANRLQINENAYKIISMRLAPLIINSVVAVSFAIALFYYDTLLAFLSLLMIGIEVLVLVYLFRYRRDAYIYYLQTYSKSIGYSIGTLNNIETIKAACLDFDMFSRWAGYYTKSLNAVQEIGKRDVLAGTLAAFMQPFSQAIILSVGAYKVMHGSLTIGMLVAVSILLGLLTEPIAHLLDYMQQLQFLKIDLARLNDVLQHPIDEALAKAEKEEEELLKKVPQSKLSGRIDITNLTFGYDESKAPLVKNFNLHIAPGSMIAIVGPTGSGKSTLLKLIGGLFDPWEGTILFDHKLRNELPRSLLSNSIGTVEQSSFPFFGTIKDNITSFNPLIEQDEMIKAAKDACIHEDILLRKGGYDLMLRAEGSNLSGGQSQRLEIARALAIQPSILLLDEATSAMDFELETCVLENVRHRGCTAILVAHRISSTKLCDEIIVVDNGVVVDRGRHEDLIKREGLYKTLYELELIKYGNG